MPIRLLSLTIDAREPVILARFWAEMVGAGVVDDARGVLVPGSETQVSLRFDRHLDQKVGPNRLHLHLTSRSPADQEESIAVALGLGATHLDIGQLPEEGHVVLADPEGNEFCVIEPGNSYLADCGRLGEITCDGTREVGLFWAAVLDWPLVWDRDEETAVQSPHGGTKIAWGGPPVSPPLGRSPQRFDLGVVEAGLTTEVDRLISLGATRLSGIGGVVEAYVELADPDGQEFSLRVG